MIHYSCDRCSRAINPQTDIRYIVRIEIQASVDPVDSRDDERDHLLEIEEILERLEDSDCEDICDDVYSRRTFDLCTDCYCAYKQNPLSIEERVALNFSEN